MLRFVAGASESEIHRSEELPVISLDLAGVVVGWGRSAEVRFSIPSSQAIGRAFSDFLTRTSQERWRTEELDHPSVVEERLDLVVASEAHGARVLSCPRFEGDTVVGRVLVVLDLHAAADRDSGDEVQSDAPDAEAPDLLAEVVELTREGVFEWDIALGTVVWNEALREMVGVLAGQNLPSILEVLRRVHPEDRGAALRAFRELRSSGGTDRHEFRLRRPDRTWRWLRIDARCILEDDRPVRMLGSVRDLTHRRQSERRAERERDELEQRVQDRTRDVERANAELRAFCYSVSHDLRAPLRSIHGFGTALQRDYGTRLPAEARDHLARMRRAALQMSSLIDALLEMARVTQVTPALATIDLTREVHRFRTRREREVPSVRWIVAPDVQAVGDPNLVRTLLGVLLDNALKFGAVAASPVVEFGVVQRPRHAIYFVRDNGAGFNPTYAGRLFQPFERLHNAAEFPGNGVGLALARRIVGRHGGTIWAESRPGEGAIFYFTLARSAVTPPDFAV